MYIFLKYLSSTFSENILIMANFCITASCLNNFILFQREIINNKIKNLDYQGFEFSAYF